MSPAACPLCSGDGGELLYRNRLLRVVLVDEAEYPGFVRVIVNAHVREMTDLAAADRQHLMAVVFEVEAAQREVFGPHKINLASFGNQVPHLHWHVIPRFVDDVHFPQPVWGERQRAADVQQLAERRGRVLALRENLTVRLKRSA